MTSTTTTLNPPISTTTSSTNPSPLLQSLQKDGFVHIPSLLTASQLSHLRSASSHITAQTRRGDWSFFRTVPKQFPPWPQNQAPPPSSEGGIWGVQHLLHPDMPHRSTFASELYFSSTVLDVVKQLLSPSEKTETRDEDLVMELFNLLVSPTGSTDFELVWHRDDVRPDVPPAEEARQLAAKSPGGRQAHAQYNVALYDDASLIVVPGSHRRVRTDRERKAGPYERGLPGEVTVEMKAGDAVFYDSNILHRGVYRGRGEGRTGRMTLHGSVGLVGHGGERARQVLQHGVGEWIGREDAGFDGVGDERVRRTAEGMRERLIEMGREKGKDGVGFSLEG